MIRRRILCGWVICLATVSGFAQDGPLPNLWKEEDSQLVVGNAIGRIDDMEKMVIELLSREDMEKHPQGAYYAIEFLKRIRSVKGTEILCKRLVYEQKVVWYDEPVGSELTYPAVGALEEIGKPAIAPLLKQIAETQVNAKYRAVALDVLDKIVGRNEVVGTIDRAIASYSDMVPETREKKVRLNELKADFAERWRKVPK